MIAYKITVGKGKIECFINLCGERERQCVAVLYWEDCELIVTIFGTLFSFPTLASRKLAS